VALSGGYCRDRRGARELKNLKLLSLEGTRVTGVGVERLKGLERLRTLAVGRTNIDERSLDQLRAAIPGLEVKR
jgi:hypothetical protein